MKPGDCPPLPHKLLAKLGFDGSDQHRFSAAAGMADRIETKMKAVDQINIRAARRTIQRAIALRFADEAVASRIIDYIGLRFDDRSATRAGRRVAD